MAASIINPPSIDIELSGQVLHTYLISYPISIVEYYPSSPQ
jgi:hypothetical protein